MVAVVEPPFPLVCVRRVDRIELKNPDAAIAQTIWVRKSLGVTTVGLHTETVTDTQGVPHNIKFDVPGDGIFDKPIYVEVHTATPLSSDDQATVIKAIADRGKGLLPINGEFLPGSQIGETVSVSDVYDAITALKLTSMPSLKVGKIFIGLSASPTLEDDIPMFYDWIATWDATVGVGAHTTFASP